MLIERQTQANERAAKMAHKTPSIHFELTDGSLRTVPAKAGVSLMRHALDNGIPGIPADCGGDCACATCHVHVDPGWFSQLPETTQQERDLLDIVDDLCDVSRLSCQIVVTEDMDGLTVKIPEFYV